MTPQTHIAPHADLTRAHLSAEQMEELLASSAFVSSYSVIPQNAVREENAVILAQPESPLLSLSPLAAAEAHLLLCSACAAELANLRDSLSLFRQATTNHAAQELRGLPPLNIPNRSLLFPALQPAHWFAAVAMLMIALLPVQTLRQRSQQPVTSVAASTAPDPAQLQSDAALLDDVDREVSASVPTPMQALADPTQSEDSASVSLQNSVPASDQRKD
jgi:hypothetical protein